MGNIPGTHVPRGNHTDLSVIPHLHVHALRKLPPRGFVIAFVFVCPARLFTLIIRSAGQQFAPVYGAGMPVAKQSHTKFGQLALTNVSYDSALLITGWVYGSRSRGSIHWPSCDTTTNIHYARHRCTPPATQAMKQDWLIGLNRRARKITLSQDGAGNKVQNNTEYHCCISKKPNKVWTVLISNTISRAWLRFDYSRFSLYLAISSEKRLILS